MTTALRRRWSLCLLLIGLAAPPALAGRSPILPPDGAVILEVTGHIAPDYADGRAQFDAGGLEQLGLHDIVTTNPWTNPAARFTGPRLTEILEAVGADGRKVALRALDGYTVTLDLADIRRWQPILALRRDGRPMSVRERGPLWLMFPFDDVAELQNDTRYYQAIWQVNSIDVE